MTIPSISIIISVYNGEKTISRCLQSLVYQTFDNIEIIVVDKESKDNTLAIARQYEEMFPKKVKVYARPYSINMAAGLTFGISVASADYVTFCDADDWFELNAMEVLWNIISENPVDIVSFGWQFLKEDGTVVRKTYHPLEETIEAQLLSKQMCTYWSRLWKKSLLAAHLPIPEVAGSDANYIPIALQDASSIRCITKILYNYVTEIGTSNQKVSDEWLTIIEGWNYLLSHSKEEYLNYITAFIAQRVSVAVNKYWLYRIEYVAWLKAHKELFISNPLLENQTQLYSHIMKLISEEKEYIPLNIFINGFGKTKEEVEQKIGELKALPLSAGTGTVYVLDETTVSLDNRFELKQALDDGKYDYVGHYCALEKIEEMGGIYVGDHLNFKATFEPILENKSFFSYITKESFSEQIWGAQAHNPVIQELLTTYKKIDFYSDRYLPLSERMKNIFVAVYDVPLNGLAVRKDNFVIYDARIMVLNCIDGSFVCEHDMKHLWNEEGYVVIPKNLALPDINKLIKDLAATKKELQQVQNIAYFKIIRKIKKISTTRFGKKIISYYNSQAGKKIRKQCKRIVKKVRSYIKNNFK